MPSPQSCSASHVPELAKTPSPFPKPSLLTCLPSSSPSSPGPPHPLWSTGSPISSFYLKMPWWYSHIGSWSTPPFRGSHSAIVSVDQFAASLRRFPWRDLFAFVSAELIQSMLIFHLDSTDAAKRGQDGPWWSLDGCCCSSSLGSNAGFGYSCSVIVVCNGPWSLWLAYQRVVDSNYSCHSQFAQLCHWAGHWSDPTAFSGQYCTQAEEIQSQK